MLVLGFENTITFPLPSPPIKARIIVGSSKLKISSNHWERFHYVIRA